MEETTTAVATSEDISFVDGIVNGFDEIQAHSDEDVVKEEGAESEDQTDKREEVDANQNDEVSDDATQDEDVVKNESEEEEEEEVPEGFNDKQGEKWKSLKADVKHYKSQAQEYQDKISDMEVQLKEYEEKTNSVDSTELEELRSYKESAEKELAATRFEATEEYQKLINEPLGKMEQAIDRLAKGYDIDSSKIYRLLETDGLAKQDSLVEEITEEIENSGRLKSSLYSLTDNYQALKVKQEELKANAASAYNEMQQKSQEAQKAQSIEDRKAFQRSVGHVAEQMKEYESVIGSDNLNGVKSELMNADYTSSPNADHAYNMMAGRVLKQVFDKYTEAIKERDQYKNEVSQLAASKPDAPSQAVSSKPETTNDNLSFADAVAAALN